MVSWLHILCGRQLGFYWQHSRSLYQHNDPSDRHIGSTVFRLNFNRHCHSAHRLATEVGSSLAGVVAIASFLLAGVGFTGMSIQPITAILLWVYDRDFGTALSVALTGASVGGILVPLAFVK